MGLIRLAKPVPKPSPTPIKGVKRKAKKTQLTAANAEFLRSEGYNVKT